jgi:signal transduction histidine kinase
MFFNTLSGRFLGLTIIFVVIAEVLIFVPAIARFREGYLQNRLELAQLAALALLASPDEVSPELEKELLSTADVLKVVLKREGVRELVLSGAMPARLDRRFDIRSPMSTTLMRDALEVFFVGEDRVVQVVGRTRQGAGGVIEVVLHETPLREAMVAYGMRVLYLSLLISVATAALLFFAVQRFIVRPMQRVIDNMAAYRDDPEDASRIIAPQDGVREIARAETALHDLQVRLTGSLRQKDRLAGLGAAVAKISHDLRNMLTTAQLLADRIETSSDPAVRRTAPKLVGSLSRAIQLCERTLAFGKAEEAPPVLAVCALAPLVEEVLTNERMAGTASCVTFRADIPEGLRVRADVDQLFRVLTNLVRNAAQAIEAARNQGTVTVMAQGGEEWTEIRVADTGPGLPVKARENLFQPFRGGVRLGGTGLGLAIAADLVRGHGGTLTLEDSGPSGSVFRILLPVSRGA